MKKLYEVEEFFPVAGDSRFKIDVTIDEDTVHVVTADQFKDIALYDYGERKFLCFETDTPLTAFYNRFKSWLDMREFDITKEFTALRMAYNPLENYNSTETKTGTETGVKTPEDWTETKDFKVSNDYKLTDTQKPNNWTETTEHSVSRDYKETETQKPTNWTETIEHSVSQDYKETETQKPTNWTETIEHSVSEDYEERESEEPTDWKEQKQITGTDPAAANTSTSTNSVIPFNATDFVDVSKTTNANAFNETTERSGSYDRVKTQEGTKTEEKTQAGTYATEHTQAGTKTEEKTQAGTYATEHTQAGTRSEERTQSGTYATEHTQSGTKTEETTQAGTFTDEMTYNTELHRSGNIGVTTSQQMLQSEIDLRSKNYARELVKEFFNLVTIYA